MGFDVGVFTVNPMGKRYQTYDIGQLRLGY